MGGGVMAEESDPFLKRWSKKKRGEALEAEESSGDPLEELPTEAENKGDLEVQGEAPEIPLDLPDVDSLTTDSDYTGFLKEGVPEELKRVALRTLWKSSPVLANLDGLNDYDEDYSVMGSVVEVIKSAYTAGKGYKEEKPEAPEPEADSAPGDDEPSQEPLPEDENTEDNEEEIAEEGEDEEDADGSLY